MKHFFHVILGEWAGECYNILVMVCMRCGNKLSGKQLRWCSLRCSKLGLKSLYRKRNTARLNSYRNDWRRAKNGGNRPITHPAKKRASECFNCHALEDLQVAHIKPIGLGGTHKNIITLCRKCHHEFDKRLTGFWVV